MIQRIGKLNACKKYSYFVLFKFTLHKRVNFGQCLKSNLLVFERQTPS